MNNREAYPSKHVGGPRASAIAAWLGVGCAGCVVAAVAGGLGGCQARRNAAAREGAEKTSQVEAGTALARVRQRIPVVREVFESEGLQLTGVAVSRTGRVFVNFPRWSGPYAIAVGEVKPDGALKPWPTPAWNAFSVDPSAPANGPEATPEGDRFVCVQSVTIDSSDRMWVLDPASPRLEGVVRHSGGPKLVRFDLRSDTAPETTAKVYRFDETIALDNSYLNDVRVDVRTQTAYITDSGRGGIVVVNLVNGVSRRVLDGHPSVMSDGSVTMTVEGKPLRMAGSGKPLEVCVDGLALSADGKWLYYQALTGRKLYRVSTAVLRDVNLRGAEVAAAVEELGETVMTDGMEMDKADNLYFSAIEKDAIWVRRADGSLEELVKDRRLAWPDSFAIGPAPGGDLSAIPFKERNVRWLYVTTSQIHRTAWFERTSTTIDEPFRVLRVRLDP